MAGLTGHPCLRAALPGGSAPPPGAPAGCQGRARLDPERPATDSQWTTHGSVSSGSRPAVTLRPPWRQAVPSGEASLDVPGSRPDLSILCYPVLSFKRQSTREASTTCSAPRPRTNSWHGLSAELTATGDTPPAFIWHTFDDGAVDVEHSLRYALALRQAAVPAELHVFPHGRHGLGLAAGVSGVERWTELCATWLAGLGWRVAR